MANIVEGRSRTARVIKIVPAYALGSEGNDPIAVVRGRQQIKEDRRVREVWLPMSQDQILRPNQKVIITPITEFIGDGSRTTYRTKPV